MYRSNIQEEPGIILQVCMAGLSFVRIEVHLNDDNQEQERKRKRKEIEMKPFIYDFTLE
jgi:hypothetical protein